MKFEFRTKNINRTKYEQCIYYLVYAGMKGSSKWHLFDNVTVKIRPMEEASEDRYFTSDGIGGYFGEKELVLYIFDSKGSIQLRTNMTMIGLEVGHMVLAKLGMRNKVPLRHDDEGGNKAGTMLPFYVAEIHDRAHEGKLYTLKFSFWDSEIKTVQRLQFRVVDFRDLV